MDIDDVADELYAVLPAEFTATRDDRARAARRAGDRELARRISTLRKPTLGAWAANLLVRATAPGVPTVRSPLLPDRTIARPSLR